MKEKQKIPTGEEYIVTPPDEEEGAKGGLANGQGQEGGVEIIEMGEIVTPPPPPQDQTTEDMDIDTELYGGYNSDNEHDVTVIEVVPSPNPAPVMASTLWPSGSAPAPAQIRHCAFCADELHPPRSGILLGRCSHIFCRNCLLGVVQGAGPYLCPLNGTSCGGVLSDQDIRNVTMNPPLYPQPTNLAPLNTTYTVPDDDKDVDYVSIASMIFEEIPQPQPPTVPVAGVAATAINPTITNDDGPSPAKIQKLSNPPLPQEPQSQLQKDLMEYMQSSPLLESLHEFDCPICLTTIPPRDGILLNDCLHSVCKICLEGLIHHSETSDIKCPHYHEDGSSCNAPITEREIKALVSEEEFSKYLQKSVTQAELSMPNSFHCRSVDCQTWIEVDPGLKGSFQCALCQRMNCLECKAVHENISCQQYKEKLQQDEWDVRTKELMQKKIQRGQVQRCPTCRVLIEKNGGCPHMFCTVCKKNFNWKHVRQVNANPPGQPRAPAIPRARRGAGALASGGSVTVRAATSTTTGYNFPRVVIPLVRTPARPRTASATSTSNITHDYTAALEAAAALHTRFPSDYLTIGETIIGTQNTPASTATATSTFAFNFAEAERQLNNVTTRTTPPAIISTPNASSWTYVIGPAAQPIFTTTQAIPAPTTTTVSIGGFNFDLTEAERQLNNVPGKTTTTTHRPFPFANITTRRPNRVAHTPQNDNFETNFLANFDLAEAERQLEDYFNITNNPIPVHVTTRSHSPAPAATDFDEDYTDFLNTEVRLRDLINTNTNPAPAAPTHSQSQANYSHNTLPSTATTNYQSNSTTQAQGTSILPVSISSLSVDPPATATASDPAFPFTPIVPSQGSAQAQINTELQDFDVNAALPPAATTTAPPPPQVKKEPKPEEQDDFLDFL